MGQTLTHGIYLPDEGERNCYNGLAGNWTILDGAVGTIAEHTTQIAGKAPLVHTHVKADITDLFNSANTWTENNTYSKAITVAKNSDTNFFLNTKHTAAELGSLPSSDQSITWAFKDKNDDNLCYCRVYYETTGGNSFRIFVRNKYTSGTPSTSGTADYAYFGLKINADKSKEGVLRGTFRPYDNNTYDLGSSSYQWNNLYAKNYYYNGVAWGLDKANTWTAQQKIVGSNSRGTISIYNPAYTKGGTLSVTDLSIGSIYMGDGGQQGLANSLSFISTDLAGSGARTLLSLSAMENTASSGTRTNVVIQYDKNDTDNPKKMSVGGALIPNPDATFPLGTSSLRWKTFNGINPGALSLPDYSKSMNVDTTGWSTSAGRINYTPTVNGWLQIAIPNDIDNNNEKSNFITIMDTDTPNVGFNNPSGISAGDSNDYRIQITFPVVANKTYYIYIKSYSGNILAVKYIAALGHI